MANNPVQKTNLDRYVVIHVATTCDEHGVYVTKDSAEVIELGWILLDAKSCEEVTYAQRHPSCQVNHSNFWRYSFTVRAFWSSLSILLLRRCAVSVYSIPIGISSISLCRTLRS